MQKLVLAAVVWALCGCAADIMKDFVGKDISTVIAQRGPPSASFDMPDGRKAFQWTIDSSYVMPTYTTVTGSGYGTAYGNTLVTNSTATAMTSGGGMLSQRCFYTLYGQKNQSNSYTVVGFEPPIPACN